MHSGYWLSVRHLSSECCGISNTREVSLMMLWWLLTPLKGKKGKYVQTQLLYGRVNDSPVRQVIRVDVLFSCLSCIVCCPPSPPIFSWLKRCRARNMQWLHQQIVCLRSSFSLMVVPVSFHFSRELNGLWAVHSFVRWGQKPLLDIVSTFSSISSTRNSLHS